MRIFKTKPFSRFAGHEGVDDDELCDAVRRAEKGLIDADLGSGIIKQQLAREGRASLVGFGASSCSGRPREHSSFTASPRTTVTTSSRMS